MHRGGYGGSNQNQNNGQQYQARPPLSQEYGQPYNQYGNQGPQPQQNQPQKPRSGGYDGPGEPSQRGPNPFGPGLGYDPAKPKPVAEKVISNTRIELPASAYKLEGPSVS
jgi:hypothetical protein